MNTLKVPLWVICYRDAMSARRPLSPDSNHIAVAPTVRKGGNKGTFKRLDAMVKTTTHKEVASMATAPHIGIRGFVSNGLEAMRVAFLENFFRRRALGAACCVYRKGEKVVDLTGRYQEQGDRRVLGGGHHVLRDHMQDAHRS